MAMEAVLTHNVQSLEGSSVLARQPGWRTHKNHGSFELCHQELAQSPLLHRSLPAILFYAVRESQIARFMLEKLSVLPQHSTKAGTRGFAGDFLCPA